SLGDERRRHGGPLPRAGPPAARLPGPRPSRQGPAAGDGAGLPGDPEPAHASAADGRAGAVRRRADRALGKDGLNPMATLLVVEDLAAPSGLGRGGQTIHTLQWLHGLKRLGHEVFFFEFLDEDPGSARDAM